MRNQVDELDAVIDDDDDDDDDEDDDAKLKLTLQPNLRPFEEDSLAEFAFSYLARPMLIEEHTEHGCAVIATGVAAVHSCLLSFSFFVKSCSP